MTDWRSSLLADGHDLGAFACGVDSLDRWLREQAVRAQRSDTARTYVWTPTDTPRVVAYYAITPTQVRRDEVSRAMSGGVGIVPAYLLARLALDRSLRGRGLGAQLLLDAVERIVQAAETAAGRLIVVDAIDDGAAAFYAHHDFQPVSGNPLRLVMKIATARKAMGR
jgi:GNAT superfamily N-acetyltransferase